MKRFAGIVIVLAVLAPGYVAARIWISLWGRLMVATMKLIEPAER